MQELDLFEIDLLRNAIENRYWFITNLMKQNAERLARDELFTAIIHHAFCRFGVDTKVASIDLGVNASTISRWQKGHNNPTVQQRIKVVAWMIIHITSINSKDQILLDMATKRALTPA